MTIAAKYLTGEGVVLAADSTTTFPIDSDGSVQHLDYAQKVFEVGENSSIGVVTWGLGSLGAISYRRLFAELADDLAANPAHSLVQVGERWRDRFYSNYDTVYQADIALARTLSVKPNIAPDELRVLNRIRQQLSGGFCFAGRCSPSRIVEACEVTFNPLITDRSQAVIPRPETWMFWGCPNLIERMCFGIEPNIYNAILNSGRWTGTHADLDAIKAQYNLEPPVPLPFREAVDWVHAMIYSTIKVYKFSSLKPVCGGPIEIATITADRPFRWVRHKRLTAALGRIT